MVGLLTIGKKKRPGKELEKVERKCRILTNGKTKSPGKELEKV
jgi:hypothetical protein